MNVKAEKKEAMKWAKKGGAYVKAIYGDGDNGMMVAGDMIALLRIADRLIDRIGDISGEGFVQTWLMVKDLHNTAEKVEVLERGKAMPYESEVEE